MSSWTQKQITILMDWVEENSESSQKCIWAQRYYDAMYYIMYSPGLIIGIILSTIRNECDPVTAKNTLIMIIIGQIIGAFDRQLNFGAKSKEFANYSSIYQSFSDRILEELVKPESIKQNGSVFYHDMNIEKQRINEKTSSIPFVIEKLYNYHQKKRNNSTSEKSSTSGDHITIVQHPIIPNLVPAKHAVRKNLDIPNNPNIIHTIKCDIAARKIQNAWYNYCHRNGKFVFIGHMMKRRKNFYNFKETISSLMINLHKHTNQEDTSSQSTPKNKLTEIKRSLQNETYRKNEFIKTKHPLQNETYRKNEFIKTKHPLQNETYRKNNQSIYEDTNYSQQNIKSSNIEDNDYSQQNIKSSNNEDISLVALNKSKTSCNLLIDNPQTKAQKKLAKMIRERTGNDDESSQELYRSYQLERFNNNFSVHDDIIGIVENTRRFGVDRNSEVV